MINWTAPSSGTYYLKVQAYSSTQRGTYRLDVSSTGGGGGGGDDHGDNASSATFVGVPSTTSGDIEEGGDTDWFRFTAVAGASYEFETTLLRLSDSTLTLYSSNGVSQLAFNDDGGSGLASLINWTATSSGTYYLKVQAYSSSQTGTYRLYVRRVGGSAALAANITQTSISQDQDSDTAKPLQDHGDTHLARLRPMDASPSGHFTVLVHSGDDLLETQQQTRIDDAIAVLNESLAASGVTLVRVDPTAGSDPDIHIRTASNSPCGAAADGVLGCASDSGTITIIAGWNWYTGADSDAIGLDQYDYQTIVTHELAHVFGLDHSDDPRSVMYPAVPPGLTRRVFVSNDAHDAAINEFLENPIVSFDQFALVGHDDTISGPRSFTTRRSDTIHATIDRDRRFEALALPLADEARSHFTDPQDDPLDLGGQEASRSGDPLSAENLDRVFSEFWESLEDELFQGMTSLE